MYIYIYLYVYRYMDLNIYIGSCTFIYICINTHVCTGINI